jgi:hypothetical protein
MLKNDKSRDVFCRSCPFFNYHQKTRFYMQLNALLKQTRLNPFKFPFIFFRASQQLRIKKFSFEKSMNVSKSFFVAEGTSIDFSKKNIYSQLPGRKKSRNVFIDSRLPRIT